MVTTQNFKVITTKNYRGVQVDLLEGHIHEFQATIIAIPMASNNRAFQNFTISQIRANKSMSLTVAQRLYEAAGDPTGTGALTRELKKGAKGTAAAREGTAKSTDAFRLAAVERIVHAYHPKYPYTGTKVAQDEAEEKLFRTYEAMFNCAYDEDNLAVGVIFALSPLGAASPDWRFPQPLASAMAVESIKRVIDLLIDSPNARRPIPVQIAIILPPEEGDDVRQDKKEEPLRLELEQHFIKEFERFETVEVVSPQRPSPFSSPSPSPSPKPRHDPTGEVSPKKPQQEPKEPVEQRAPSPELEPEVRPERQRIMPEGFVKATPLKDSLISLEYKNILIQVCSAAPILPAGPPYAHIYVTDAAIELKGNGGAENAAVHERAGPILQEALNDLKKTPEYREGYNGRGAVWTTDAYGLGFYGVKRIIHAVGPLYLEQSTPENKHQKEQDLVFIYGTALQEAIKPGNNEPNMMIAFSLISTNRNNVPAELGAGCAIRTVIRLLDLRENFGGINHIVFIVPQANDPQVQVFKDILVEMNVDFEASSNPDPDTSGAEDNGDAAAKPSGKVATKTKVRIREDFLRTLNSRGLNTPAAKAEEDKILEENYRKNLAEMRANAIQNNKDKRDKTTSEKKTGQAAMTKPAPKPVKETRILPPRKTAGPVKAAAKKDNPNKRQAPAQALEESDSTEEPNSPQEEYPRAPRPNPKAKVVTARSPTGKTVNHAIEISSASDSGSGSDDEEDDPKHLPAIRKVIVIPNGPGPDEVEDGSVPDAELHRTRTRGGGKRKAGAEGEEDVVRPAKKAK
ncbi:hypothetical protein VTL71DRAFT_13667 [Oculimacula yallundae]|uniref:Macro domain-containing protein n=1 Tax=Oculimacula yallundae TaxID=86028 RepID=A0ABR4CMP9_9HELO